ncbi:hypothetical protein WA026_012294 [Henosepilachna vigintioctopunctata]|uniref:Uncharacterized protein n=1 Tax=Henosepilachna vigintioctopunctata TaxID=420089 RepID=A0AAW1UYG0_9CUCU
MQNGIKMVDKRYLRMMREERKGDESESRVPTKMQSLYQHLLQAFIAPNACGAMYPVSTAIQIPYPIDRQMAFYRRCLFSQQSPAFAAR